MLNGRHITTQKYTISHDNKLTPAQDSDCIQGLPSGCIAISYMVDVAR